MIEYNIEREERDSSPYKYEFVLYIDGKEIITATELEEKGYVGPNEGEPWNTHLHRYAEAYIRGMHH